MTRIGSHVRAAVAATALLASAPLHAASLEAVARDLAAEFGGDRKVAAGLIVQASERRILAPFLKHMRKVRDEPFDPARAAPGSPCRRLNGRPDTSLPPGAVQWLCNPGGIAGGFEALFNVGADGRIASAILTTRWGLLISADPPEKPIMTDSRWNGLLHKAFTIGVAASAPTNVTLENRPDALVARITFDGD